MESLKELYRIGIGPSSSHSMGPKRAAEIFLSRNPTAKGFRVFLYGSLAATGKGHLTDKVLEKTFEKYPLKIIWRPDQFLPLFFKAKSSSQQGAEPHPDFFSIESFRELMD